MSRRQAKERLLRLQAHKRGRDYEKNHNTLPINGILNIEPITRNSCRPNKLE